VQNGDRSGAGVNEAQHQLDQRGFPRTVMADQGDGFARRQRKRHVPDRLDAAITLADVPYVDCVLHVASRLASYGREGGPISARESTTPPGSSAGNCDCAQRITCTAALVLRSFACGAAHTTLSTRSLARYAVSAMPSPFRSKAGLSLQ